MTEKRNCLWSGFSKEDAEANLKMFYLPADPGAYILKKGDRYQIRATGFIESVPKVVKRVIK